MKNEESKETDRQEQEEQREFGRRGRASRRWDAALPSSPLRSAHNLADRAWVQLLHCPSQSKLCSSSSFAPPSADLLVLFAMSQAEPGMTLSDVEGFLESATHCADLLVLASRLAGGSAHTPHAPEFWFAHLIALVFSGAQWRGYHASTTSLALVQAGVRIKLAPANALAQNLMRAAQDLSLAVVRLAETDQRRALARIAVLLTRPATQLRSSPDSDTAAEFWDFIFQQYLNHHNPGGGRLVGIWLVGHSDHLVAVFFWCGHFGRYSTLMSCMDPGVT